MTHAYESLPEDIAKSYRRIHANGEETRVHILSCGEDRYVTVAVDVDPKEFQPGAAATIAYSPSIDAAHERAQAWMEAHPRGVDPGGNGDSPGILQRVWQWMQKFDMNTPEDENNA
jgi:hypothetical protein